jgi:serine/threonine-protein kinase HipA
MEDILGVLGGSESAAADRGDFALAQLGFWLLAATDGHAKNFSIQHHAGGGYGLTPLYDVLSAWPIIGAGANQLALQDAKLAMAVRGKNPHYRIAEIQPRHWQALALRTGVPDLWRRMRELVESAGVKLDAVQRRVPPDFPERVTVKIADGVRQQARAFLRAPAS